MPIYRLFEEEMGSMHFFLVRIEIIAMFLGSVLMILNDFNNV